MALTFNRTLRKVQVGTFANFGSVAAVALTIPQEQWVAWLYPVLVLFLEDVEPAIVRAVCVLGAAGISAGLSFVAAYQTSEPDDALAR